MFCIKCGNYCPDGDTFCAKCGTALPEDQTAPKKKGRLLVPMIIMLVFIVIGFSAFFLVRETVDPDMPWYSVKYGTLTFNEARYSGTSQLNVPATILDTPVTKIDDYCFYNCTSFEMITISDGVQAVGSYAFANSTNLKGINLPDSVTEIGAYAFYYCEDLEAVRLSAAVDYLDADDFYGCTNLKFVFFHGTAQQWEETFNGTWPYDAEIILVNGDGQQTYQPS